MGMAMILTIEIFITNFGFYTGTFIFLYHLPLCPIHTYTLSHTHTHTSHTLTHQIVSFFCSVFFFFFRFGIICNNQAKNMIAYCCCCCCCFTFIAIDNVVDVAKIIVQNEIVLLFSI